MTAICCEDLLTPASVTVPFAAVLQAVQQVTEDQQ